MHSLTLGPRAVSLLDCAINASRMPSASARSVSPVLWRGTTLFPVRPYIQMGHWQPMALRLLRAEILLLATGQVPMWRR